MLCPVYTLYDTYCGVLQHFDFVNMYKHRFGRYLCFVNDSGTFPALFPSKINIQLNYLIIKYIV